MKRLFFAGPSRRLSPLIHVLNFSAALLLIGFIFYFSFYRLTYHWGWSAILPYKQKFLQGWLMTLLISVLSLIISTIFGLFFALARRSNFLPLQYFSKIYVEVIRGTPLLVQILIFFYVVAEAFSISNRLIVGVLTLSVFSAAYIGEVIRGGIESVGESQLESARAIGLTRLQTYRYVIFPQAIRQILPSLAGQFASLIKDSSLLSIIGINEFTLSAQQVNTYTYSTLESYIPLAIGYLILTLPISLWTQSLERKHKFET